jgi:hypothetical protein
VPLAGKYIKKESTQAIDGIHFLCRTCHATAPTLTCPLNITNGSQHALEHFQNIHPKSYKENLSGLLKELNKANAIAVINDYNLCDKVGFFVLDNVSSNDTAVAVLGETLQFDPKVRQLRCVGYILNLVAQQLLFGSDFEKFESEVACVANLREEVKAWQAQGPIGIVAMIVQWINKSPGRVKRFEDSQCEIWHRENTESYETPPPLRLKMDNATRYIPIS